MLWFIVRRLVSAALISVAVSAVVFFGGKGLAPGNIVTVLVGSEGASPEQIDALNRKFGLDKPLVVQYLDWLYGAIHGDFGISLISRESVSSIIGQQAPVSLELALFALIIATGIGVPIGILAAVRSGGRAGWAMRLPFLIIFGVPVFVAGTVFVLVTARFLPFFYSATYVPITEDFYSNLVALFLPALSAGLPTSALVIQMTRVAMLDSLAQPYIVMARAKGVPVWKIHYLHALKAAFGPILTLIGFQFGILLGSLFVVEEIFSLPGLGRGVLGAIGSRDFGVVQAQVLVIAIVFILGNLIVDIVQPIIDRRIVT